MENRPGMNPLLKAPLLQAMWRGFRCTCPKCGEGKLFGRFLKVAPKCEACGEDYTPQKADDFPAYCVIVVVGHIVVPLLMIFELYFDPGFWAEVAIFTPITAVLSLALLQPTKGAIVGLQWELGMHGFHRSKQARVAQARAQMVEAASV